MVSEDGPKGSKSLMTQVLPLKLAPNNILGGENKEIYKGLSRYTDFAIQMERTLNKSLPPLLLLEPRAVLNSVPSTTNTA